MIYQMVDNTSRAVNLYRENLPLKECGVLSDIKSLYVTHEYQLSAQQLIKTNSGRIFNILSKLHSQ